jgi:hypothetical protein
MTVPLLTAQSGLVVTPAFNLPALVAEDRVCPRTFYMGFVVDHVAMWQVYPRVQLFARANYHSTSEKK